MLNLLEDLQWRGLIHQSTDLAELGAWLQSGSQFVYAGFDPTSDSLHVGHLMPLMLLRRFQRAGHRPIALAGGATGMIGDPSGKSDERSLLTHEQLDRNLAGIRPQLKQLLEFEGPTAAVLVDNAQWMGAMGFVEFLRDVGKHVPVNMMLAKDSVSSRLSSDVGISFTEFCYMLLQAYDFVHLYRQYGCRVQLGGSDQWGNITAGIDLGRRLEGVPLMGLTCPLLVKTDGTKMGKTEQGAVWLSPQRTTPYAFYQYWLNVADEDAGRCLRVLTELAREEIEHLDEQRQKYPEQRTSQLRLAEALTQLIHGEQSLRQAQLASEILFGKEIDRLTDEDLTQIFSDVPTGNVDRHALQQGLALVDALVVCGLAKSKAEARRVIQQGGAYVNNRRIEDSQAVLTLEHLASETAAVLRSGKKKYALLRAN